MKNSFIRNIASALRSAGVLMVGTGLMIWVLNKSSTLAESLTQYATLSIIVGGCFVMIGMLVMYVLTNKKTPNL
jgi:ABC-type Mn2+/Zn2+ transport system permease subunit